MDVLFADKNAKNTIYSRVLSPVSSARADHGQTKAPILLGAVAVAAAAWNQD